MLRARGTGQPVRCQRQTSQLLPPTPLQVRCGCPPLRIQVQAPHGCAVFRHHHNEQSRFRSPMALTATEPVLREQIGEAVFSRAWANIEWHQTHRIMTRPTCYWDRPSPQAVPHCSRAQTSARFSSQRQINYPMKHESREMRRKQNKDKRHGK